MTTARRRPGARELSLGVLLAVASVTTTACAEWMPYTLPDMPIERVLTNLQRGLDQQRALIARGDTPSMTEAHLHYLLGRVHGVAYEFASTTVRANSDGQSLQEFELDPSAYQDNAYAIPGQQKFHWMRLRVSKEPAPPRPPLEPPLDTRAVLDHLRAALDHALRAVELEPDEPLYNLGLAHALRVSAHLPLAYESEFVDRLAGPEDLTTELVYALHGVRAANHRYLRTKNLQTLRELRPSLSVLSRYALHADPEVQQAFETMMETRILERAVEAYEVALSACYDDDLDAAETFPTNRFHMLWELASYEAAKQILAVAERVELPDVYERVTRCKTAVSMLTAHVPAADWITPLLVHTCAGETVCLDPRGPVEFDLDADGRRDLIDWPAPCSRLLVWTDEVRDGELDGRALFGNVTWWMFFAHGFQPLALLDDDGDG